METRQLSSPESMKLSTPQLDALSQQPSSSRSVEVDVQRLADIRASLQDIQRRKSAPLATSSSSKLSAMQQSAYSSSISARHQTPENVYQPLHAASPALFPARQLPFAQRDLNKEVKVYQCSFSAWAQLWSIVWCLSRRNAAGPLESCRDLSKHIAGR